MEQHNLLEDFQKYLKKKNLSQNSIVAYSGSVRLYYSLYSELTPENLKQYKKALLSRYKPATVNQRIYAINHYAHFLAENNELDGCPPDEFHLPSVKMQQRSFLDTIISNRDYESLKDHLKADENWFWYFIVRFLAATGARVSELVQIKVEHLNLGYLDLYSKGGKIRRIYFPDQLCEEALEWCRRKEIKSGFLFLTKSGHPITTRGIHFQLKHFARRYGINPDTVYPHSFRHRFAKNFLARFNDISLLADLTGHDSIETTRIYLTRSSEEQQNFLDEMITW